ncbi:MAG: hypothetical protein H7177_14535 [Rhizobacter sp.]|nr:hypothetical protein [Bacteriovorax sp.]
MSKKAKFKKIIDPFTNANDIQKGLIDKKKSKRTPAEKNRRERHLQKEIVRQLTEDLVKLSEKDILEDTFRDHPAEQINEVVYTIRPVKSKDEYN